ncbi:MAG: PH domain-containing protein [Bacilli bacterium]|nr:PH domain-containing protein [Bacilli bacterium]
MKLKNYLDNTYYVVAGSYFTLCLVLSTLIVILRVNTLYLCLGIGFIALITLMMFFFYCRNYEFDRRSFVVRVGIFKKRYLYKNIKKSFITENHRMSYATSKKRIAIVFKNKKEIWISPEKMDEALLKLINNTGGK